MLHVAEDGCRSGPRHSRHRAGLRRFEAVEGVDEHQGVLVDGVAVVGVADDEGIDAVELGEDEFEDADGMHGAKRVTGVRADEDLAKAAPERGAFFKVGREQWDGLRHALFAAAIEAAAGAATSRRRAAGRYRDRARGRRRGRWVRPGAGGRSRRGSLWSGSSLRRRGLNSDARETTLQRPLRCFSGTASIMCIEAALNNARVAEIEPHPVGGVRFGIARAVGPFAACLFDLQTNAQASSVVLRLPVEGVVVALMPEVEEAADGEEEVDSVLELFTVGRGSGVIGVGARCEKRFEPAADMDVAQAAGAVLDAGLEVKEGVAVLAVAFGGELGRAPVAMLRRVAIRAASDSRRRRSAGRRRSRRRGGDGRAQRGANSTLSESNFSASLRLRVCGERRIPQSQSSWLTRRMGCLTSVFGRLWSRAGRAGRRRSSGKSSLRP